MRTVVHVQAGWHAKDPLGSVDETRWINSLPFGVDGAPTLGAIVVQADPSTPGIGDLLDAHLRATPLVRGVRCMAAHHDDRGVMNWTQAAHLLTQPAFLRGFEAVAERGLSFDTGSTGISCPMRSHWPAGIRAPRCRSSASGRCRGTNSAMQWLR